MSHPVGTFLFVAAIVGNAALIAGGLLMGTFVMVRRSVLATLESSRLAAEHDRAFHHPDRIHTPLGEWLFLAAAGAVVMVGLPVLLATMFQFVIPWLGRAWTR